MWKCTLSRSAESTRCTQTTAPVSAGLAVDNPSSFFARQLVPHEVVITREFKQLLARRLLHHIFCRKTNTMTAATQPTFEPGRVYRTRELQRRSANAPRLAQRLVLKAIEAAMNRKCVMLPGAQKRAAAQSKDFDFLRAIPKRPRLW